MTGHPDAVPILVALLGGLGLIIFSAASYFVVTALQSFFRNLLTDFRANHDQVISSVQRAEDAAHRATNTVRNLHQALAKAPEMLEPYLSDPDNMETKEPDPKATPIPPHRPG